VSVTAAGSPFTETAAAADADLRWRMPVELVERRLSSGQCADLAKLLEEISEPPIESIGALTMDAFLPRRERKEVGRGVEFTIGLAQLCQLAPGRRLRRCFLDEAGQWSIERAEERLHELTHVRRKHGMEPDELVGRLQTMKEELQQLSGIDHQLSEIDAKLEMTRAQCLRLAQQLHEVRLKSARELSRVVQSELTALHIPKARFEAQIQLLAAEHLTPRGLDLVEFLFSANPGEPMAPLARVASGGELSRVLLAIRGALAGQGMVSTYVFDEVDAGVGGAVAEAIGQRLARASVGNQVLCITHLPQIAAFADTHFQVEKHVEGGRTLTRVRRLTDEERTEELARMLGGARISTSARAHARQLIEEAAGERKPQRDVASVNKRSKRA